MSLLRDEGPGRESDPRLLPFDYRLPEESVARFPPERRDGGRLALLRGAQPVEDLQVSMLPELLSPGDLLVLNDTRVVPARLRARRRSGGRVELLFLPDAADTLAMVRPGRRLRAGETLEVLDPHGGVAGAVHLRRLRPDGTWEIGAVPAPATLMEQVGEVPLPPYLARAAVPADAQRYQTVYAREAGAVAAPTAGLHLSEALLARLAAAGVQTAALTLHVGAGTFRDLRPADLDAGRLHAERYHLPAATAEAVRACRARGGRVVAVGTTVTRVLETAAEADGGLRPGAGSTELFLRPGHRFRAVDGLWTNLHLPRSSLLMLVCAFGGQDRVMAAYRHCVDAGYRFFSYGDAMLLLPGPAR